jgi:cytochrome c5
MNKSKKSKEPAPTMFALAAVIALMIALPPALYSADTRPEALQSQTNATPAQTNSVTVETKTPVTDTKNVVVKRQITGAELYSIHCNRCHPERYPTERTGAQWRTIMLHMQVRANIPVKQAKLIMQYLEDNSGR